MGVPCDCQCHELLVKVPLEQRVGQREVKRASSISQIITLHLAPRTDAFISKFIIQ